MPGKRGKILVVSRNPKLAEIRKTVLESAGFTVIPATDDSAVESACSDGIELIVVGYSVTPSDKRRVWAKSRQCSDVPVMELGQGGDHELLERNVFAQEPKHAHDFIKALQRLSIGDGRVAPEVELEVFPTLERFDTYAGTSSQSRGKP